MQVSSSASGWVQNNIKVIDTVRRLSKEGKHVACFVDPTEWYHTALIQDEAIDCWVIIDQSPCELPDELSMHLHLVADVSDSEVMKQIHGLFATVVLANKGLLICESPYNDLGLLLKDDQHSRLFIEARPGIYGHAVNEPSSIDVSDGTYTVPIAYAVPINRHIEVWNDELKPQLVDHLSTLFQNVHFFDEKESLLSRNGHFALVGPIVDRFRKQEAKSS